MATCFLSVKKIFTFSHKNEKSYQIQQAGRYFFAQIQQAVSLPPALQFQIREHLRHYRINPVLNILKTFNNIDLRLNFFSILKVIISSKNDIYDDDFIDLIYSNYSDKISNENAINANADAGFPSFKKVSIFGEFDYFNVIKDVIIFCRAFNRYQKKNSCGTTGKIAYDMKEKNIKPIPLSCNNVTCPKCQKKISNKQISQYFEPLNSFSQKALITLTVRNCQAGELRNTVSLLNKSLTNLYHLRISKNLYEEYKKEVKAAKMAGWSKEKIKNDVKKTKEFYEKYEGKKINEFIKGIFSHETTYNHMSDTYHPHLHGIIDLFIPKLLLNAAWRVASKTKQVTTDIRAVSAQKGYGVLEVLTYPFKIKSKKKNLSKEVELAIEFAYFSRQKLHVWGVKKSAKKQVDSVIVAGITYKLTGYPANSEVISGKIYESNFINNEKIDVEIADCHAIEISNELFIESDEFLLKYQKYFRCLDRLFLH